METIYINWHGPFTRDDINCENHCKDDDCLCLSGNGLYALFGMQKYERKAKLQYIGLTQRRYIDRFNEKQDTENQHRINDISRNLMIWLGKVETPKRTVKREILEAAEYALIYFSEPQMNEKKTIYAPKFDCTVISRFFHKNSDKLRKRIPKLLNDIPDVISWNASPRNELHYCTRLKLIQQD
ncbi:hypothetical protein [Desulfovibrio litoralis]|uniref:Uncharacterized protein n=1 Tax=Desulfovibrio litoralis DSM 11393 TaxID=1121455 RepID=A0A1M7S0N3_9BACT|nr:hypothetical protein [Desulfovibrio litoralis]SHN51990.1 hypothetical protein SAMN02745728_00406 [Desulfovibrio litoralis DSM 11393]